MIAADLLDTIVAATRRAVEARQERCPQAELERRLVRRPRGEAFETALRTSPEPRVIAECKRRSPSRGILRRSYNPAAHALAYARAGAAAISVLTEPTFFDGTPGHLAEVRGTVDLPLLRKDFIITEYQLIEAAVLGAEAALLIVAALDHDVLAKLVSACGRWSLAALVEVHDAEELRRATDAGAQIIGVNSRNLRTLDLEPRVHDDLARAIPAGVTLVAESGIRTSADLKRLSAAGYHAFLVGERLITHDDPGAALRELRGR